MGDGEKTPFKLNFDRKVHLEFRGATITSTQGFSHAESLMTLLALLTLPTTSSKRVEQVKTFSIS